MASPVLPAYLARIQRISRPQVKLSMALKAALDTPYRKKPAHPRSDLVQAGEQLVQFHVAG